MAEVKLLREQISDLLAAFGQFLTHEEALVAIMNEIGQTVEGIILRTCPRCHYGDMAFRETWNDGEIHWVHGVDWRGEVHINPEPCDASTLHELFREIMGDTGEPTQTR